MMTPAEVERRNANRRSIHPRRAMAAGDTLAFEDLDFRRPGYGIAPTESDRLVGKTLRSAKPAAARLDWADLALCAATPRPPPPAPSASSTTAWATCAACATPLPRSAHGPCCSATRIRLPTATTPPF